MVNPGIIEYVQLYELAVLLGNKHLENRLMEKLPTILTNQNFSKGYSAAFESKQNEDEKMHFFLALFENFYLDHKNDIRDLDNVSRKTLNCVRTKKNVTIGKDDFSKEIQRVKTEIWKSKDYKDLSLLCKDGVKIECHKAVIGVSPLFKHFDFGLNLNAYPMEFTSRSLTLFLQLLYLETIEIKDVSIEDLVELFHLCEQSDMKDASYRIVLQLKSQINEKTCSKMLDFYFDTNLEDKGFWNKIQVHMKASTPQDLCSMYLKCCEKHPSFIKRMVDWMVSHMNEKTSSAWLVALDENEIDNQTLWGKVESTMNAATLNLWTSYC
jgi:hypothetical protein